MGVRSNHNVRLLQEVLDLTASLCNVIVLVERRLELERYICFYNKNSRFTSVDFGLQHKMEPALRGLL
jgi:hypothetical protein